SAFSTEVRSEYPINEGTATRREASITTPPSLRAWTVGTIFGFSRTADVVSPRECESSLEWRAATIFAGRLSCTRDRLSVAFALMEGEVLASATVFSLSPAPAAAGARN